MHVIDVNSGQRGKKKDKSQEENALEVNLEAAEEVARQLRLRDMGGIIVVDFIDMREAANRKLLYEKMKEFMAGDRAKHNILPPSKFGLVQITRQRVRPEMSIKTAEKCPCCNGTGEIQATILIADEIENNLRYILQNLNLKKVSLVAHPFVEAYLTKGLYSIQRKWYFQHKKWTNIRASEAYQFMEYRFFDDNGEQIVL